MNQVKVKNDIAPIGQPLFEHQEPAFRELLLRANAFFDGNYRNLKIKTRWHSLVIGPTGTGKTQLAAILAKATQASLLIIALPSWQPLGTTERGGRHTIAMALAHIMSHERVIILLDEADKLYHPNGWNSYIRAEAYSLLDGIWPAGLKADGEEDDENEILAHEIRTGAVLRSNTLIIAAGTFQEYFDDDRESNVIGFHARDQQEVLSAPDSEIIATKIPRELSGRFHAQHIFLPQLQLHDYRALIERTADNLPAWLVPAFRKAAEKRLQQAAKSKAGCRFIESSLADAIIATPTPSSLPSLSPDPTI